MKVAVKFSILLVTALGALSEAPETSAHHSVTALFDTSREIDREGIVRGVRWINPHVNFEFEVTGGDEAGKVYVVETQSVSALRGRDITQPFVSVGDRIRVIGNPPRRGSNGLNLLNILLMSGEELVLSGSETRFADAAEEAEESLGTTGPSRATEGDASQPDLGIFRVWTTVGSFPFQEDIGNPELAHTLYPLTDAARAALESFDPIEDSPLADCAPKGIPTIMEQPYPTEFRQGSDGDILLRLEEYDAQRHIHMDSTESPSNQPPSLLGFSQGYWDGDTLIVQTSRISWPWFDTVGVPLDPNAVVLERFTPSEDGSRLDLSITITAPETFTRPVEVGKYYLYVADVEVQPYECTL